MKKNKPFESGMAVEDVIEFVRIEICKDLKDNQDESSNSGDNIDKIIEDNEDDGEDTEDSDGEVIGSPCLKTALMGVKLW